MGKTNGGEGVVCGMRGEHADHWLPHTCARKNGTQMDTDGWEENNFSTNRHEVGRSFKRKIQKSTYHRAHGEHRELGTRKARETFGTRRARKKRERHEKERGRSGWIFEEEEDGPQGWRPGMGGIWVWRGRATCCSINHLKRDIQYDHSKTHANAHASSGPSLNQLQ